MGRERTDPERSENARCTWCGSWLNFSRGEGTARIGWCFVKPRWKFGIARASERSSALSTAGAHGRIGSGRIAASADEFIKGWPDAPRWRK